MTALHRAVKCNQNQKQNSSVATMAQIPHSTEFMSSFITNSLPAFSHWPRSGVCHLNCSDVF